MSSVTFAFARSNWRGHSVSQLSTLIDATILKIDEMIPIREAELLDAIKSAGLKYRDQLLAAFQKHPFDPATFYGDAASVARFYANLREGLDDAVHVWTPSKASG